MRKLLIIAMIMAVLLVGCSSVGKPEIKKITYEWGKVNESTTQIIVKVDVYNPNPFPIPLKDVVLTLYMNGIEMGKGHAIKAEIPAHSESTLVIAIDLDNYKIPEWWVSHIRNGEKTVMTVKGYLLFDLKLFEFKYPISFTNEIETNILSAISTKKPERISIDGLTSVVLKSIESHWGNVNDRWTEVVSIADVYNPNPYPIPVISFDYTITMNGILVGKGSEDLNTVIPPKSDAKLTLITKIDNDKLSEWWVSHIRNGERSVVVIEIKPKVKIAGRVLEFTLAKQEFEIRTSFLG